MNDSMFNNYYVYVYIDPRNFEEFYYGKGKGNRKAAHLHDDGDSEKTKIIREITKEGLEPIIKVIAKNLTESEALLVEKTLIFPPQNHPREGVDEGNPASSVPVIR